ncbi:MAG: CapA family protein [Candidatus Saccharibacteria bacterium]|nr:CapA family protein [Candidatus Saccharibacteria bacterium]
MFKMLNEVKKCRRAGAQIIAMNLHVGGQYNIMPETYTKWVANKLVRAGADIVAACHEHVIHPIVTYKNNSICAMSLGNFIYHSDSESLPIKAVRNLKAEYSIMLNVDIDKINNKVKIQKVSFSIFKNHIVDGLARVIPIEEIERIKLIKSTQLQKDVNYIVKKVTGLDAEFKISKEYIIND